LEAELRHASEGLTGNNIEEWIAKGEEKLNDYWRQYYYLLLLFIVGQKSNSLRANTTHQAMALEALDSVITDPWKSYLPVGTFTVEGKTANSIEELVALELPAGAVGATIIPFHNTRTHRQLRERAEEFERSNSTKIPWQTFVSLEERFAERLAARSEEQISQEDFTKALREILDDGKN
jgi:hypothetical protein